MDPQNQTTPPPNTPPTSGSPAIPQPDNPPPVTPGNMSQPPRKIYSRRKVIILIVSSLLTLALAFIPLKNWHSSGHKFPKNTEQTFLAGCKSSGASTSQCQCGLSYLEDHISYKDAVAASDQANNGTLNSSSPYYQVVQDAIKSCKN